MVKFGKVTKSAPLRTTDFAIIVAFLAIHKVVEFSTMFTPFAAMPPDSIQPNVILTLYFPQGIIQAVLLKIIPKPSVAFTYVIAQYFLLGVLIPLSPLWTLRYILPAVALETYYLVSKRGTLSSLLLMGLSFGILSSVLGTLFFVALWDMPTQPLLLTLPVAILSGISMTGGSLIGYGIGALIRKKKP